MSRAPIALAAVATGMGLAALASATGGGHHLQAQAVHAALGLTAGLALRRVDTRRLADLAYLGWAVGIALLLLVLAVGKVAGGARSWLPLGPVALQPSELMKVLVPMVLAAELTRTDLAPWMRWARAAGFIGVPAALIVQQPDMGAVGLLVLGAASIAWLAGLPRLLLVGGIGLGALSAPAGWLMLEDYQRGRILTFLDPTRDPSGAGYQTLQSLYAAAGGGWTGAGFGAGTQGRLGFLPEHETDFILSSIAEDAGVVGAVAVLAVLFALVGCGLWIAERSKTRFESLLAAGLSVQLGWQIVINAGGVLGLLPLTGVTLPFISYGGSSLLVVWVSTGLLAALGARTHGQTSALGAPGASWWARRRAVAQR